jgi:hypothetical protein
MSPAKRVGALILLPLAGALIAFALGYTYLEGRFVIWQSLGKPPEKAVKLVAIARGLWVETESGRVYHYDGTASCGDRCWVASDYPAPDPPPYFTIDRCGWAPSFTQAIDTKAICEPWGPGSYLYVYAIRKDGNVFMWEHGIGEENSLEFVLSPCMGGATGLLAAISVILANRQSRPTLHTPDTESPHG